MNLQDQQQEADSDHGHQQEHQSSKAQSMSRLMHDFDESGPNSCSESLVLSGDGHDQKQHRAHSITNELQVICTSAEGQVIMASALDTASAVVRQEQDTDLDHSTAISVQAHGVEQPEQAAMFAQILGQQGQQGMEVQAVLPEMSTDTTEPGLETDPGLVPRGESSGLMTTECLMEVVAANGLASLGQDVTAVTNASDSDAHHQTQGTFMVTLDNGHGIIIQHTPDASVHQGESEDVSIQAKDERDLKHLKVS